LWTTENLTAMSHADREGEEEELAGATATEAGLLSGDAAGEDPAASVCPDEPAASSAICVVQVSTFEGF
jgi:hypothetical protein